MGFKVGRVFELEFTDTDAAGAVVKVRSASVQTIRDLLNADVDHEITAFVEHLIEWNLEYDDGSPVPMTAAGVLSLEEPFKRLLILEWMKATRGISHPFDRRSDDGAPSPPGESTEQSIPMEPL